MQAEDSSTKRQSMMVEMVERERKGVMGKESGNAGQKTAACSTGEARFYDKEGVEKQGNGEGMELGMRAARIRGGEAEVSCHGHKRT